MDIEAFNLIKTKITVLTEDYQNPEKIAQFDNNLRIEQGSLFFQIRDLRHQARVIERQHEEENPDYAALSVLWEKIKTLSLEALNTTKDIEIAVWLSEALLRTEGFPGLAEGFKLLQLLVRQFWPDLYPVREGEDLDTQLYSLTGLNGVKGNGSLIGPMCMAPVDLLANEPVCYWDYKLLCDDESNTVEKIIATLAPKINYDRLTETQSAVAEAEAHYRSLSQFLDAECGIAEAPPTSAIYEVFANINKFIELVIKLHPQRPITTSIIPNAGEEDIENMPISANALHSAGPIQSRRQAFERLEEIITYFSENEPNSPVTPLLERAIRWGNMSFADLLNEIIIDPQTLEFAEKIVGIQSNEMEEDD